MRVGCSYGKFSELMMECGHSDSGVLGTIVYQGNFVWEQGQDLTGTDVSIKSSDLTWAPDVPGYNSGASDTMWQNHVSGVHYPNFGATFAAISAGGWTNRDVFTCNPQSNAYGNGDVAWASGTGTKFVRVSLKPSKFYQL